MATFHSQTVDIYEDFEDATGMTITQTDANVDDQAAAAAYAGTKGLAINVNGATAGGEVYYIGKDVGAIKASISTGFWFYAGALSAAYGMYIFAFSEAITSMGHWYCALHYRLLGAEYQLRLSNEAASFSSAIALPAANAWYWVTMLSVDNNTCSLAVYDTNGTQVGTTVTVAGSDRDCRYLVFGNMEVRDYNDNIYFDELVADYADSTFPLLGWDVAAGGSILFAPESLGLRSLGGLH